MSPRPWAFLSSHGVVLLEVSRTPNATVRELAERAQLTERQAHRVLADLVEEGYVARDRVGRRNQYRVNREAMMRLPNYAAYPVRELLDALGR